jgi:hypothetical protein
MQPREQTTLLKTLFSTFLEGKVDQLLEPRKIALAADAHFAPLEASTLYGVFGQKAHVIRE